MTTSTETPVDTWNMSRSKMPVDVGSRKASPSIHLQTPQNPLTPQSTKLKKGRERERESYSLHIFRSIRAPSSANKNPYSSEKPRSRGTVFCWPFSAACVAFARFWLETDLASQASQPFKNRWNYGDFHGFSYWETDAFFRSVSKIEIWCV